MKIPFLLIFGFAGFGLIAASLPGCSQSSNRYALEGTVTFDGEPLADGSILFYPMADTKSPSCGGKISDGHFSVSPSGGASPGTFRVEITASRNTGRKVENPRNGALIDEIVQYIPPRYNRQSELKATVGDQGDNRFEFVLTAGSAR